MVTEKTLRNHEITGTLKLTDGNATIAGDVTGNARGSGALDIQSSRDAVTEVASGADSVTVGNTNTASVGYENIAIGVGNTSSGSYYGAGQSSAIGYGNSVSGDYTGYSSAIGYENTITGSSSNSSAIGYQNTASDYNSSAFGYLNTASGRDSSAFGYNNTASGQTSSAFGNLNTSVGQESAVFGYQSATDGYRSYAFGYRNVAAGDYSFALGVRQFSFADSNILVGNASAFFNINSVGFSVNNMNALVGFHATSDLLVTDISSLGAEKVTNGTFTGSATGWTLGTGWTYGSNNVKKLSDGTGTLSQDVSAVAGEYYLLTFYYNTFQIGTLDVSLGGQSVEQLNGGGIGITGTYKAVIKATTTGHLIFTPSNDCRITGGLDDVSVKKITGGDIQPLGDITFLGAGRGLSYGEIYTKNSVAQLTLNDTAKVQVTSFTVDGESNNMTPAHAQDHITVDIAGKYMVTVSSTIENVAAQAHVITMDLYKNNGATIFANVHSHRQLAGGGGDVGAVALSGIVDLAVNDTIEVWLDTDVTADRIVIVEDITLSLIQIGG